MTTKQKIIEACDLIAHYPEDDNLFEEQVNIISSLIINHKPEASHRERHIQLHKYFDELLADFIAHTKEPPLYRPIKDLMEWSFEQTKNPTEETE